MFVVSGAFATGVSSTATSADCDKPTLNTYTGTSNLQASWGANEINLRWYNNNTLMEVGSSSSGCTYDSTLTPPTAPSRMGYTFKGWHVRPTMNFSAIPTNENGTTRWGIGWYNNANYCWYEGTYASCSSDATYSKELQTHEWKVKYSHGELYGMSGCSTTSGTWGQPGNPTIGSGQYCWCKATGYKATGSNEIKGPLSALSWVYYYDDGSVASCARDCANDCAFGAELRSAFRGALFAGQ